MRLGAPVKPREPPTTSTVPAVYLFWLGCLRGTSARIAGGDEPVLGRLRLEPDVGDDDLARSEAARGHLETHLAGRGR